MIEAAAKGASTAIALVANIAANLIAFLAFLAFFNGVLSWLGSMVGKPETSFEVGPCPVPSSVLSKCRVEVGRKYKLPQSSWQIIVWQNYQLLVPYEKVALYVCLLVSREIMPCFI